MANNLKYYSEVRIISKDSTKFIEKSYDLSFLSRNEIEDLKQRILIQRSAFEKLRIPISALENIEIIKTENGFSLVVIERFEGLDFIDVVDVENLEMYLDRVLTDIYEPLLTSTKEKYLAAGIDTSIRNYVYRLHTGEFCYVDFMPPKVNFKGHYTQEVPEIKGPFYDIRMYSHNKRAGIVYTLYINLARHFPSKRKFIVSKIEQFLTGLGEDELLIHIKNSPFYRVDTAKKVIELVDSIDSWHKEKYFQLREAACVIAELNNTFTKELPEFFKLTHHETNTDSPEYGKLPQNKFEQAKTTLINALQ